MSNGKTSVVLPENAPDEVKKQAAEIDGRIQEFKERRNRRPSPPDPEAAATSDPAPQAAQPPPREPADPTPAPTETEAQRVARLETENSELRHKIDEDRRQFAAKWGSYGGNVQQLKATIVDLQSEVANLKSNRQPEPRQAPAETPPGTPSESPWLVGVTEEDKQRYGEEFFEKVWKTSQMQFESLRKDLNNVKHQADERVRATEERYRSERFAAQVEVLCPGASEINGNPSTGKGCALGWAEFLDTPVMDGGVLTRRQEAEAAVANGDAKAFANLIIAFKNSRNKNPTTQRQTVLSEVVPMSIKGKQAPQTGKRKIPESEIRAWSERVTKAPPGTISAAEIDSKMLEYAEARREGRVYRD